MPFEIHLPNRSHFLILRCVTFMRWHWKHFYPNKSRRGQIVPSKICSRIKIGLFSRTFSSAPSTTPISSLCIPVFSRLFLFPFNFLVVGAPSFDIISAASWRFGIFKQMGDLGKILKKKKKRLQLKKRPHRRRAIFHRVSKVIRHCFVFLFTSSCDWLETRVTFPTNQIQS